MTGNGEKKTRTDVIGKHLAAIDPRWEQLNLECVLVYGLCIGIKDKPYWPAVWKFLCDRHADLLECPDTEYPTISRNDMNILSRMHDWQLTMHYGRLPTAEWE